MRTFQSLKQYAYYYLYAIAITLALSVGFSHTVTQVSSNVSPSQTVIVIDPGHGGEDGGAVSITGSSESHLNLDISLRLRDALRLLGYDTLILREQDAGLHTQGGTIRERKRSDLSNRVAKINSQENALLISIHQNHFSQSQYSGPQVFYAGSGASCDLAEQMQENLNRHLAPGSRRATKKAEGIYLMQHIRSPGILIECGFLSNPEEARRLETPEYQKQLAAVISTTAAQFLHSGAMS